MLWPPVATVGVTLPLNTPPVTVPLLSTLPAKVPPEIVPGQVFVTVPLKMPLLIVPKFDTVPLKVPPVIVADDSILIAHATGVVVGVPWVLPWGWVELKSYVPSFRYSVPFLYLQLLPLVPSKQSGRPFAPMTSSGGGAAKAPRGNTESTMLSARIRLRMRFFIGVVLLFCQRLQQRPHGRSFLGPAYHKSGRKGSKTA